MARFWGVCFVLRFFLFWFVFLEFFCFDLVFLFCFFKKKSSRREAILSSQRGQSQNWHLLGNARRLTYVCSFSKTAVSLFMSLCSSIFLALRAAVQREDSHSSSKLGIYELFFF